MPDPSTCPPGPGADALPLTGERTMPGVWHERYWFARHEAAYRWVVAASTGTARTVVEAGCGEGYGAHLLAVAGHHVLGLDLDLPTLAHARSRYDRDGLRFARANLVALPLARGSVDLVVSLQVVEHLWDPERALAETARVLRPGGLLALTTPNRLTFSPGLLRRARPVNPFHAREFDADELVDLVARHLNVERVLGVRHGPRLRAVEARRGPLPPALLAHPFHEWDDELVRTVRTCTAQDFEVSGGRPADALDLLVVARAREGRA